MPEFIGWILLGLIAGALAKLLMPGDQAGGCLRTTILGIAGALIGGFLGQFLTFLPQESPGRYLPSIGSVITATVGAFVLLFLFGLVFRRK